MPENGIQARIKQLKEERNAVILAHNYQLPEVQDVADLIGDSLALATEASRLDFEVIIFCGVNFMAETAKILSPRRTVVLPEPLARCPMADMADAPMLRQVKARHPDAVTVSYVNTTADVKAESDICCTSGNAVKVVRAVESGKVIFTPDRNLGLYVQRFVPDKEFILWPGHCAVHNNMITVPKLAALKSAHPDAEVLVHPECTPEVIDFADHAFSTHGMLVHAKKSHAREFILGTEREMAYRMTKDIPGKAFYTPEGAVCVNMKRITLDKVLASLETLSPAVELEPDIMERARAPLERMVRTGRGE